MAGEAENLWESVAQRLRQLDDTGRREFELRFGRVAKSEDTVAVLVWCFGHFGIHRFYLGHHKFGAALLGLAVLGWWLVAIGRAALGAGVLLLCINGVAVLVDIVGHERLTKKVNLVIKNHVLNEIGRIERHHHDQTGGRA